MSTDVQVKFFTKSQNPRLQLSEGAEGPYVLPTSVARIELSSFLRGLLELEDQLSFDFRIKGHLLAQSVQDYLDTSGTTSEDLLEIEYVLAWRADAPRDVCETPSAILSIRKVGEKVVVLCVGGRLYIREDPDIETAEDPLVVRVENDMPLDLLYHSSLDTKVLVVAQNGEITCVDITKIKQGEILPSNFKLQVTGECLARARLSGDGQLLAVIDHEGQVSVFEVSRFLVQNSSKKRSQRDTDCQVVTPTVSLATSLKETAGIAFVNHQLVLVAAGQTISLFDLSTQSKVAGVDANKMIMAMSSTRDGSAQFATGHFDGRIRVWQIIENKELKLLGSYMAHGKTVTGLEWAEADEQVFASIGNDQQIAAIDVQTKITPIATVKLDEGNPAKASEIPHMPTSLAWWSDRKLLYGTTHNKLVSCYFSDRV